MNTNFKKLIAGASVLALVIMNLAFTNAETPTAIIDVNQDIVISDSRFLAAQNEADLTVYLNTVLVSDVDLTLANGSLTIAGTFDSTTVYEVNYIHNDGTTNFAGAVVVEGADAHQVTVTATVLPILSMTLDTNSLDFGELDVANLNTTAAIGVTASTNATQGFTISLASLNNGLENETTDLISYAVSDNNYADNGSEFYRFALGNATNVTLGTTTTVDTYEIANTANQVIASTLTPVSGATFEVTPQAGITTNTAAGNYSDTLTFSITGSF